MNSDDKPVKFTTLPAFVIYRPDMVGLLVMEESKPTYIKLYTASVLILAIINTLWLS